LFGCIAIVNFANDEVATYKDYLSVIRIDDEGIIKARILRMISEDAI
jgi:hypothetical protein